MTSKYREVWQTWSLVKHPSTSLILEEVTTEEPLADASNFRFRMQTARISRRLTIAELSTMVKCDAETLAGFERGDEVVSGEVQTRLRKVLQL